MSTKGASELDKSAHRIYTFATGKTEGWYKPGVICPQCGRELETSYCEERVYMVRCPRCKTVAIAAGKSPRNAAEKIGIVATPAEDWHEDYGDCLWWHFPIEEPPYLGSPISFDRYGNATVPKWCTHFTRIHIPSDKGESNQNKRNELSIKEEFMEAKQVIKELKELQVDCIHEEGHQALEFAIRAIRKQLKEEWIPVEKKLPKKDTYVLACFDDGFVTGVEYADDWELWADSGEVIAWKPLPKAYKEKRR